MSVWLCVICQRPHPHHAEGCSNHPYAALIARLRRLEEQVASLIAQTEQGP